MTKYRLTFELTVNIEANDLDHALDIWDNTVNYKDNPVEFVSEENTDIEEIE